MVGKVGVEVLLEDVSTQVVPIPLCGTSLHRECLKSPLSQVENQVLLGQVSFLKVGSSSGPWSCFDDLNPSPNLVRGLFMSDFLPSRVGPLPFVDRNKKSRSRTCESRTQCLSPDLVPTEVGDSSYLTSYTTPD